MPPPCRVMALANICGAESPTQPVPPTTASLPYRYLALTSGPWLCRLQANFVVLTRFPSPLRTPLRFFSQALPWPSKAARMNFSCSWPRGGLMAHSSLSHSHPSQLRSLAPSLRASSRLPLSRQKTSRSSCVVAAASSAPSMGAHTSHWLSHQPSGHHPSGPVGTLGFPTQLHQDFQTEGRFLGQGEHGSCRPRHLRCSGALVLVWPERPGIVFTSVTCTRLSFIKPAGRSRSSAAAK